MGTEVSTNQNTLKERIDLSGVGVHSGKPVTISLLPADLDTGIVFQRSDVDLHEQADIPAIVSSVGATDLCTVLGDPAGVHVKTVEHLMAALVALHVDNVIIEVDSAEIPVMDGSSEIFVEAIDQAGLKTQGRSRRYLRVLKEVRFAMGASWGEFTPHDGTRYEVEIDFEEENHRAPEILWRFDPRRVPSGSFAGTHFWFHEGCGTVLGSWICPGIQPR